VTVPQHKAGKIRGLAVTSMKRAAAVPELPTVNEALGLKDYELIAYFAVFAPAGTPPGRDPSSTPAINAAANSKDLQDKFAANGFAVDPGTPDAWRGATRPRRSSGRRPSATRRSSRSELVGPEDSNLRPTD
jgi:tripartite-type tricarboxylate transporter receptor subunit TctC